MIHARRRKAAVFVSVLSTRGGGPSSDDAGQEGGSSKRGVVVNFCGEKPLPFFGKKLDRNFLDQKKKNAKDYTVKNGERMMMAFDGVFWFRGQPNR